MEKICGTESEGAEYEAARINKYIGIFLDKLEISEIAQKERNWTLEIVFSRFQNGRRTASFAELDGCNRTKSLTRNQITPAIAEV